MTPGEAAVSTATGCLALAVLLMAVGNISCDSGSAIARNKAASIAKLMGHPDVAKEIQDNR